MHNKIINKYKRLILVQINRVDPIKKLKGRPIKHNYNKCLTYIFDILITGLSWNKYSKIKKFNLDAIRKRFNKWIKLNIFINAYNGLLKIYKKKYDLTNLYIDSTVIGNLNGSLTCGYNIKIKNKRSIKISAIVDDNKIPHMLLVTPSNPHDAKIMEELVEQNNFDNKLINLIGDKGYIKSANYINHIKKQYNIKLVTPQRINALNMTLSEENKKLLNKRFVVENFFSLLKRCYLRINIINDKKINTYNNYLAIIAGLLITQAM